MADPFHNFFTSMASSNSSCEYMHVHRTLNQYFFTAYITLHEKKHFDFSLQTRRLKLNTVFFNARRNMRRATTWSYALSASKNDARNNDKERSRDK